ncbi:MAG TPA: tryptophan 7-halogenase [Candidatus Paceibacterota bacterium]|nr:tryptophan 7-halogenase [Candidatus Paceibacterota bacterium]
MKASPPSGFHYDVVIVGGALSGAATAILLLREQPKLRLLIVEKTAAFGRRVGEATVEVSGYFLCRVLGLTQYLNEAHLVKQGMRFWFSNENTKTLADSSEIGGKYLSRVPAFQVDRACLDEEVLRRAAALGAEIWRPAVASNIRLNAGGNQTLEVRIGGEDRSVSARWIVDASGIAAVLSRQERWWRANEEHPTTAVWARWTGVKDWDGLELAEKFPEWSRVCNGIRSTATNHLVGPGWWAWCIPLKGGDVSIGVVFDQRLVQWPEGGALGQRLKDFLSRHPVGAELLADAHWREGDVFWRKNLPYFSTTFAGDGFALVGDAGAFMDPFYSPGMDWVAFTSWSSAQLILAQQRGEKMEPLLVNHNRDFSRSYRCWFEAVYKDKYEYVGDFELMRIAFRLDLGLYYLGIASQPYKRGPKALGEPPFSTPPSVPFYRFMKFYNRRFAKIARARRNRSAWGRKNDGHRFLIMGFTFSGKSAWPVVKALFAWIGLEVTEGWRSWFDSERARSVESVPAPTAEGVR